MLYLLYAYKYVVTFFQIDDSAEYALLTDHVRPTLALTLVLVRFRRLLSMSIITKAIISVRSFLSIRRERSLSNAVLKLRFLGTSTTSTGSARRKQPTLKNDQLL